MIPYSTQDIADADVKAVERAVRHPYLTQGPAIERFEKQLAEAAGTKYAVAVSSGTAALHAAYAATGIGKGDEVIVPAMTFAATANAVLYLGAVPVFADVDPATGLIDVADAERKITKKTKLLVSVDYSGRPAPYRALRALAKKYKLAYVSDGAHSLGATYYGQPVGGQADMTTFSLHPVKSIATGEGGAIATNDRALYEFLLMFRTHGITKDPKKLTRDEGPWYQEMHALGFNYRMTDIQAALGESQMKRLSAFIKKRRALAARYPKLLAKIPGIVLPPPERTNETSAWHLYPIQVDPKKRRAIFEAFRAAGIGVQVHYLPVYRHPYYESIGYKKGLCLNAESFYAREISIPIYPRLSKRDQDAVAHTLKNIFTDHA